MINLTVENYSKKVGTKTVWNLIDKETKTINNEQYKNIVDAKGFFKRLGGSESHTKPYSRNGFCVTKIISVSPDKQSKMVKLFTF